jgi:broad specificity phosphatase PhoE
VSFGTDEDFSDQTCTPDWNHRNIPYDILPGPLLTPQGEKEAEVLAAFLESEGVGKLYHSPFARAAKTAQIISAINRIPCLEESRLAEWRMQEETEIQVRRRMKAIFDQSLAEAAGTGSIGLVSHGGPIGAVLQELGIDPDELLQLKPDLIQQILCHLALHGKLNRKMEKTAPGIFV